jgi:hypothetical protein
MKIHVIALAILGMIVLIASAVAWDSVRMAAEARRRVALTDDELKKHEMRLVKLLADSPKASAEVKAAIDAHRAAPNLYSRHAAYDRVVTAFRQTMSDGIDPTNPLDRKFMDDIAGAINRRELAAQSYDQEAARYQSALDGFRGRIARFFSAQASADLKPEIQ